MDKSLIKYSMIFLLIPVVIGIWIKAFDAQKPAAVMLIVCILACIPFFLSFERKNTAKASKQIVLVSCLTALCIAGRIAFVAIPGFKPVTAIIILAALYLGPQSGFMIGALTALISNFYFGQGPWTPMQMLAWGLCGFLAGVLSKILINKTFLLLIFSALCGILFSLIMDIWSVLWMDNGFNLTRYFAMVSGSMPFMLTYMVSNVIFVVIIQKPFGMIMNRIKSKYGI